MASATSQRYLIEHIYSSWLFLLCTVSYRSTDLSQKDTKLSKALSTPVNSNMLPLELCNQYEISNNNLLQNSAFPLAKIQQQQLFDQKIFNINQASALHELKMQFQMLANQGNLA